MNNTRLTATVRTGLAAIAAVAVVLASHQASTAQGGPPRVPRELRDRAAREGRVRVLVQLNLPGHEADGLLSNVARLGQRQRLSALQTRVLSRLSQSSRRVVHQYATLPYVALSVDASALTALENAAGDVVQVLEDTIVRPVLAESA